MGAPTSSGSEIPPNVPAPAIPSRRGLSKGVLGAIGAVVAIVVILLALLLSGVVPGFKLSSSGGGRGGGGGGVSYNVTFSESGLTAGTSWSVTLAGTLKSSSTATIVFSETNGTYSFTVGSIAGLTASPGSGSVSVGGAATSKAITFTPIAPGSYSVTFTESGLPSGTTWSVTLNGSTQSSSGTSIGFTEKNGTYSFTSGSVTGYTPDPASGSVTVNGVAVSKSIIYSGTGGGGGVQTSYSQASPVANSKANSQGSGWVPVFAGGISLKATYSNSSTPALNASCPLMGGPSSWPTLSAWTGAYANGYATYWVFLFYNSSASSLMFVFVSGGTATIMGTLSGPMCVSSTFHYFTGLGSGIIDSTAAASAVASNDSAYVAANPQASAIYSLNSGGSFGGSIAGFFSFSPMWGIHFTTCSPNGGGTGSNFTAEVNATNGHVISSSTSSGACGTSPYLPGHRDVVGVAVSSARSPGVELRRQ